MKIAFVSQPFDDVNPVVQHSSLAIWTHQVAKRLCAQGCEIVIYAKQDNAHPKTHEHNKIQYRRVPVTVDEKINKLLNIAERALAYPSPKRPSFARDIHYLPYILQVAYDLRSQNCNIVHIISFSQFAPVVKWLNPSVRVILHMHSEWLSQLDPKIIGRRLESVDLMIGCSDHITQKVQQRFPNHAERCRTVYNGVSISQDARDFDERAAQNDAELRLLFVGRVSPEKGVHVLLEAMRQIVEALPNVRLKIVGGIGSLPYEFIVLVSDEDSVSALSRLYKKGLRRQDIYYSLLRDSMSSEIAGRVTFVGSVPHSEVGNYYRTADVLVNPSLSESFGISLVEAMGHRLPVVVSRVGGMKEIVEEGRTGLLVEPGNATALADAVVRILADGETRRQMGEAGFKRAIELFSWDRIAEETLRQYRELLNLHA